MCVNGFCKIVDSFVHNLWISSFYILLDTVFNVVSLLLKFIKKVPN